MDEQRVRQFADEMSATIHAELERTIRPRIDAIAVAATRLGRDFEEKFRGEFEARIRPEIDAMTAAAKQKAREIVSDFDEQIRAQERRIVEEIETRMRGGRPKGTGSGG